MRRDSLSCPSVLDSRKKKRSRHGRLKRENPTHMTMRSSKSVQSFVINKKITTATSGPIALPAVRSMDRNV
eukprot:scaffold638_cov382-Prasinococcus_capsulatus_cf.AAC.4